MNKPSEIDAAMFADLCNHACFQVREAVMRVVNCAPRSMAAGILMDAAQDLAVLGAVTFVASSKASQEGEFHPGRGLMDPKVCAAFVVIARAWALAPDQAAAEKLMHEGLTALGGTDLKVG